MLTKFSFTGYINDLSTSKGARDMARNTPAVLHAGVSTCDHNCIGPVVSSQPQQCQPCPTLGQRWMAIWVPNIKRQRVDTKVLNMASVQISLTQRDRERYRGFANDHCTKHTYYQETEREYSQETERDTKILNIPVYTTFLISRESDRYKFVEHPSLSSLFTV